MPYVISDDQFARVHEVLQDVTGLASCNCSGECQSDCTYSMAVALLGELDAAAPVRLDAAYDFVEDELERRRTGLFADEDPYIAEAEAALAAITKVIAAR
jgi:hypothetical protein